MDWDPVPIQANRLVKNIRQIVFLPLLGATKYMIAARNRTILDTGKTVDFGVKLCFWELL
jgi:hypothetical protein